MARVVMYSTGLCVYCTLARRLLARRGIPYEEHRLSRRSSDRDEEQRLSGGGRSFPQIVIDGRPVGGFAELRRLERDGALERMLGRAA